MFDCEASDFVWKRVKCGGIPPEPRFGHAQALGRDRTGGDGYLFVFGGGRETLFDDCHVLNLQTHKWQPLECGGHQPPPRSRHTATRIDQQIVIYGGTGWGVTDDLYILDLPAQEWDKVVARSVNGDLPGCRKDHTLTAMDNSKLILFGGAEGSGAMKKKYNDVFILEKTSSQPSSPTTSCSTATVADDLWTWTRPTVLNPDIAPPPTSGHSAVWDEVTSRLIVFGGEHDDRSFNNTVWILSVNVPTDLSDPNAVITAQWTRAVTCGTPPQPQSSHACMLAGRNMFVFGGWSESIARATLTSSSSSSASASSASSSSLPSSSSSASSAAPAPSSSAAPATFRLRDRCSNNVSIFQIDTLHWTHLTPDSKQKWPSARAAAPLILVHPTHALLWSGRDAFNTERGSQLCYDDMWQFFVRAPLPPEPPTIGRTSTTQIQVKWASTPGVRRFRLEMSTTPEAGGEWECVFQGFSNQYTCDNLAPATLHNFRITGWNPSGWGTPSPVVSQTTPAGSVPAQMKPLILVRIYQHHLRLAWEPPANNGGCSIDSYIIQHSVDGRRWDRKTIIDDPSQHSAKIANLQPNTTYYFRIAAINKIGVGKFVQIQCTTLASESKQWAGKDGEHQLEPALGEPRSLSSSSVLPLTSNDKLRAENEALKLQVAQLQNQMRLLLEQKDPSDPSMSWRVEK